METTIVIITQYYCVRNGNPSYCLERQQEVDFCLIQNCENPFIDQIHLLLEEEVDLSFLPEKHIQKITKKIIKKRLTYEYAFQYYNDNLTNTICILQNADIYTDETIEILKHVNFDMKVILALNRYETNNHLMNGLCNNDYSEHSSNYLIPYQASIWSQDAWVWKTKDAITIPESNFELGIVGCDNYIATLFKENGYHVMNSSYLVCTNHHDHLSIEKTEYGLSKGNVSRKTTNRIKSHNSYLFLQNLKDIPDQYTQAINHEYFNHSNHSKTQYTSFQKTIHEIVLEEHQITASSFSNKYLKPVFSKFNKESYWEPHEDDYEPFIEYDFSQTEELVILDIQGKKVDHNDINFGYVTEFKVKYFLEQVWYEGGTHKGITVEQGNYMKRIYFSKPVSCEKIRIYPTKYRNICALQLRFYSSNAISNNLKPKIQKEIWNDYTCFYYDNEWQEPTPTEKCVFDLFKKHKNLPHHYFAFPWSTLNDNKFKNDYHLYEIINNFHIEKDKTYFTVELHESFVKRIEMYKKLNIKYVFASQCTNAQIEQIKREHDLQIIPFSLHPTQNSEGLSYIPIQKRKLLTNFVGLVYSKHYISDIRQHIFESFKDKQDCYIKKRDKWHYEGVIYEGKDKSDSNCEMEYKEILMNSKFTLCPSGSGPNSIRLWEVLSFGSIPVLLADTLMLPELLKEKWEDSIIFWKENEIEKLYTFLQTMNDKKLVEMSKNGRKLYETYFCEEKMNQTILNYFSNVIQCH